MRVCQPGPSALKRSTTSRLSLSDTATLVGCFCGPRTRQLFASVGNILTKGFARRKSRAVHSGLSGSAAMPAWMRTSSALESLRALRLCFVIKLPFCPACPAQADHGDRLGAERRKHERHKVVPQPADGTKPRATVCAAVATDYDRALPVEQFRVRQIEPMCRDVGLPLGLVPDDLHIYRIYDLGRTTATLSRGRVADGGLLERSAARSDKPRESTALEAALMYRIGLAHGDMGSRCGER